MDWKQRTYRRFLKRAAWLFLAGIVLTGCGKSNPAGTETAEESEEGNAVQEAEDALLTQVSADYPGETEWQGESAKDDVIDFAALQEINPEIFAWVYVPGTRIDYPVCQSPDDVKYETHDAAGNADSTGAIFTETANLRDMCDFNEVLHGSVTEDGAQFSDLQRFLEPAFFDSHYEAYVYLDGNKLTYTLFAAYRRDNTSLLRTYDFSYADGCEEFIRDLMMQRDMSTMFRAGYEDINAYNFLITLTAHTDGKASDAWTGTSDGSDGEQVVVLGVLTGDDAGTVDREMGDSGAYYEYLDGDGSVPFQ